MAIDYVTQIESHQQVSDYTTTLIVVSTREIEVLQLISQGLTVKEIANELYLSTHTIISHKKNLIEKFEARNSIDLIVKAIRMNIINIY